MKGILKHCVINLRESPSYNAWFDAYWKAHGHEWKDIFKMKLEVGKRYVDGNGTITKELSPSSSARFPFVDAQTHMTYAIDGKYSDDPSAYDLVSEFVQPQAAVLDEETISRVTTTHPIFGSMGADEDAFPSFQASHSSNFIICDLDGTLANAKWREQYAKDKNWAEFHRLAKFDEPIWSTIRLLQRETSFANDAREPLHILILTGRTEDHREETEKWLKRHLIPFSSLVMRPVGMLESDFVYKRMMIYEHVADLSSVLYALEDRDSVVKMLRDLGITTFQVNYGAF